MKQENLRYGRIDGIAVLTLDAGPAGAPPAAICAGIAEAVAQATEEADLRAVVLTGLGQTFGPGDDPDLHETDEMQTALGALCRDLEEASVPVIAALRGPVHGPALSAALACHWRVAAADAELRFPETALGLPPGGHAIARAARIAGARAALRLGLGATAMRAAQAAEVGLIDRIAEGDVDEAAIALGEERPEPRPSRARRDGFADPEAFLRAVAEARGKDALGQHPAGAAIIDLVEGALLLPAEQAWLMDDTLHAECRTGPVSQALRHLAGAARAAMAQADPLDPNLIGVVGHGPVAETLVIRALDGGLSAILVDPDGGRLAASEAALADAYAARVASGDIRLADEVDRLGRLQIATALGALDGCAVALATPGGVDAVEPNETLLARLEAGAGPGAHVAQVSDRGILELAADGLERPEALVGLRIAGPVRTARLAEIVAGPETGLPAMARGRALAAALGLIPVETRAGVDGIGARIIAAGQHAALVLIAAGARPEEVDAAMRAAGFARGPAEAMDAEGLDVVLTRARRLGEIEWGPLDVLDLLVEAGRTGGDTGAGFFAYEDGRPRPDPRAQEIIDPVWRTQRVGRRRFSASDIRQRCLAAMANAGARLIVEGAVTAPAAVDLAAVHAGDFPAHLGGPMKAADLRGLPRVERDLKAWMPDAPGLWTPAPVFRELVKNGRRFSDLDG